MQLRPIANDETKESDQPAKAPLSELMRRKVLKERKIFFWGEVEDGRVVIRKDSCPWDDAVDDITDRELKYLVCCYGDFFIS